MDGRGGGGGVWVGGGGGSVVVTGDSGIKRCAAGHRGVVVAPNLL
jgi:hypothetical protein